MFHGRNLMAAKAGSLLLVSGLAMAGLAGCGSAGSSTPGTASSAMASTPGTAASQATASVPSWAAALGPGVTVVAPKTATPGHDSPGAVVAGLLTALAAKKGAMFCGYGMPSAQAQCRSTMGQMPASKLPYAKNAAVGYVVIDGDKAAVGMTGTFCTPGQSPECVTNNDPAAVFSLAHSFSGLWENAISDSGKAYSLTPCEKIDGKWYLYAPS